MSTATKGKGLFVLVAAVLITASLVFAPMGYYYNTGGGGVGVNKVYAQEEVEVTTEEEEEPPTTAGDEVVVEEQPTTPEEQQPLITADIVPEEGEGGVEEQPTTPEEQQPLITADGTNITDDTTTNDTRINDTITALGEQPQPQASCHEFKALCYCDSDASCDILRISGQCTSEIKEHPTEPGWWVCNWDVNPMPGSEPTVPTTADEVVIEELPTIDAQLTQPEPPITNDTRIIDCTKDGGTKCTCDGLVECRELAESNRCIDEVVPSQEVPGQGECHTRPGSEPTVPTTADEVVIEELPTIDAQLTQPEPPITNDTRIIDCTKDGGTKCTCDGLVECRELAESNRCIDEVVHSEEVPGQGECHTLPPPPP